MNIGKLPLREVVASDIYDITNKTCISLTKIWEAADHSTPLHQSIELVKGIPSDFNAFIEAIPSPSPNAILPAGVIALSLRVISATDTSEYLSRCLIHDADIVFFISKENRDIIFNSYRAPWETNPNLLN